MPNSKQPQKTISDSAGLNQYQHLDKKRHNNPQVGMVTADNDSVSSKKRYSYDPHLDPTLMWSGKQENQEIEVDTVSIHVHERIDPKTIISSMYQQETENYQASLFEQDFNKRPLRDEVSFYQHKNAWSNRIIAGDSLLVMNSLLEKEGMAGSVQMVYIDPPYGIKYRSNFQPYTNQPQVADGDKDSDLNVEPEMIKAFRDTWELDIHSYLSYMRDRLLLTRELLSESGSCFVQISDENVHHIKEIMEEVFGSANYVDLIPFKTTSGLRGTRLTSVCDYIIWFAKSKSKMKHRPLFLDQKLGGSGVAVYKQVELIDGTIRPLNKYEIRGGVFLMEAGYLELILSHLQETL